MRIYVKNVFGVLRYALFCAGLAAGVLFVAAPFSCTLTDEGIAVVAFDRSAPKILSFGTTQCSVLAIACDEPITLMDVACKKAGESDVFTRDIAITYDETRRNAKITLGRPTEIGEKYELSGIIVDTNNNTLAFALPFTGYNDHLARVILSELRHGHSGADVKSRKAEFVEMYVLAGGNLGGLELYGGYYGNKTRYEFPAIEVETGEYITVHLRNYYGDTDERGTVLNQPSASPDANNAARDLWVAGSDEGYFTKNDVVVIVDTVSGAMQDAVLLSEDENKAWSRTLHKTLANKAVSTGVWQGGAERSSAANSDKMGISTTLSRQNIAEVVAAYAAGEARAVTAGKADWMLAAASPGQKNNRP